MVVKRIEVVKSGDGTRGEKDFYADLDAARKRPGCGGCGGCLVAIIVGVLLLLLGVATLFAKTGIVQIPVLSEYAYKEDPAPRRVVEGGSAQSLSQLLERSEPMITASGGTLTLTESDLTAALREPGASGEVVLKRGQIVLDSDSAELYGQVTPGQTGGQPVIIRVTLEPTTAGSIEATQVQVGYLELPVNIARFLARYIFGLDLGSSASLAAYGVTDVTLGSGELEVTIDQGGVNIPGLGATAGLNALGALESLGIDPQQLNEGLTPELIDQAKVEFGKLSPEEQTQLEQTLQDFPQLQLLDQPAQ